MENESYNQIEHYSRSFSSPLLIVITGFISFTLITDILWRRIQKDKNSLWSTNYKIIGFRSYLKGVKPYPKYVVFDNSTCLLDDDNPLLESPMKSGPWVTHPSTEKESFFDFSSNLQKIVLLATQYTVKLTFTLPTSCKMLLQSFRSKCPKSFLNATNLAPFQHMPIRKNWVHPFEGKEK